MTLFVRFVKGKLLRVMSQFDENLPIENDLWSAGALACVPKTLFSAAGAAAVHNLLWENLGKLTHYPFKG